MGNPGKAGAVTKHPDQVTRERYLAAVKQKGPRAPVAAHLFWAFVVGGGICAIGQLLQNWFIGQGMEAADAVAPVLVILIFASAVLTALGVYDDLGELSGAGAAVPITGFANSVVSAAMDFKREGFVLGMGAKMFLVAGPVIVYAILIGFAVGLIKGIILR